MSFLPAKVLLTGAKLLEVEAEGRERDVQVVGDSPELRTHPCRVDDSLRLSPVRSVPLKTRSSDSSGDRTGWLRSVPRATG